MLTMAVGRLGSVRARLLLLPLLLAFPAARRPRAALPCRATWLLLLPPPSKEMVTRRAVSYWEGSRLRPRAVEVETEAEAGDHVLLPRACCRSRCCWVGGVGGGRCCLLLLVACRCTEGRGAVMVSTGRGDVGATDCGGV